MRTVRLCLCLALLMPCGVHAQRSSSTLAQFHKDTRRGKPTVDTVSRGGALNSLLHSKQRMLLQLARAPPAAQVLKRAQPGSRFALSLDVPTSILSVLIDLAKNQDLRTKAAANAELMARVGKRK
ncbi:urocortin-3-like isoform X2 [Syngnathoides biaculeatus]|nr:urocortin-3-like isoform X2 [Syngnathoides biaculeatus]XP_061689492.1 urocortin-3-like isoform X2 [Syngnathoides biaculeatus]